MWLINNSKHVSLEDVYSQQQQNETQQQRQTKKLLDFIICSRFAKVTWLICWERLFFHQQKKEGDIGKTFLPIENEILKKKL